jgi:hypothetical protein
MSICSGGVSEQRFRRFLPLAHPFSLIAVREVKQRTVDFLSPLWISSRNRGALRSLSLD